MSKKYAVIKNTHTLVENTIVAPEGFTLEGFYLVELEEDNSAQPGAYYNPADGRFYGNPDYSQDYRQFVLNK